MGESNKFSADFIKMLIDYTPIAYVILDKDYRINYINESFAKLRHLDMSSVYGEKCFCISNGGTQCSECAVSVAFSTGDKAFISRKDILPDGTVRFIDDYAIPLQRDEQGGITFVLEIMINRTAEMLAREQRNKGYDEILRTLTSLLEAKDTYTATHSESVRKLSINLAKSMGFSENKIFDIAIAASLHDIGKLGVPDDILKKKGSLTNEEYDIIKKHPVTAYEILKGFQSYDNVKHMVRHHHERMDGRGYPDGLKENEISMEARVIAVADTYDAITSTRAYRNAFSHEYAIDEIQRVAGTQLDKSVVQTFVNMDFLNLSDELYSREENYNQNTVERSVKKAKNSSSHKEYAFSMLSEIDLDNLLMEIFKNTPCGYVLLDYDYRVHYVSEYFLEYMQLNREDVMKRKCFEAAFLGTHPCEHCSVRQALESGKVEYIMKEQQIKNDLKIFDLFGVPIAADGKNAKYILEVIIDRTDEVMLERVHEREFNHLIEIMHGLFEYREGTVALSN